MFDAGAIVFNIRTAGVQVFEEQVRKADRAVEGLGKSSQTAADKTEQLGKKQETATQRTRRLAQEQANAAKKAAELATAQDAVGKALVTAGAAVVATTALTVNAAIQWESAWAGVTKTVDGTAEELGAVSDGLRDLTSVLPGSHTEIAAVAEAAGQLGVETKNVVAFTRTMIDLGETTNLSANDAATALARFMNVMGTSQDKVSNLGSSVVELGNNYATTEAEIVAMATRLSGAARQVGLTEGETVGLATALSSVGIEAEAGGSAVSKVMIDIAASVDAGGERVQKFASIAGMSADDFAAKWRTEPGAALAVFVKGLADAEAQGGSTLGMLADLGITEVRMRDALLRSAAASDEFTGAMKLGNEAFAENNALQKEAEKRYATVESQLGIMRNRVNDAAIDLGSVFLPAVADAAGAVGDFADGIASLPAPVQEVIASGGLMIGMVALLGGTALVAVPKVMALWTQIRLLTAAGTRGRAALSGLSSFLGGPWAIAMVAATAAMVALSAANKQGVASTEDLKNSLITGATAADLFEKATSGRQVDQFFWGNYKDSLEDLPGLLDRASAAMWDWGDLSFRDQGALGGISDIGDALGELATTDLPAASRSFKQLVEDQQLTDEQAQELLRRMPALRDELLKVANANGTAGDDTALLNMLFKESAEQSKSAAAGYIEAAEGAQALRKDLDQLLDLLNEANGVGQDAITANIDYRDTLAEVDAAIQNARDGVEGYALTLDQSEQSGRDNMGMLVDLAKDAWAAAEAQYALDQGTMSAADATALYRSRLEESRQALIDRITELGLSADAAAALADQIMGIPSDSEWEMIAKTATAQTQIDTFIYENSGREIILKIGTSRVAQGAGGGGGITQADGGVVSYHANGSVSEHHVAQMARAGDWRVWAEPETGGETYVPHALSKRARSEQIMAETAELFGGVYIPGGSRRFADGGVVTSPASPSPGLQVEVILSPKGGIDILKYVDVQIRETVQQQTDRTRSAT